MLTDPDYGIVPSTSCEVLIDEKQSHVVGEALLAAADAAEDFLLVYFGGHGLVGGRDNALYLGMYYSRWQSPTYGSLSYNTLRETVLDSPAATKTVILDCCFSGRAFGTAMASSGAAIEQMEVDGTYVLASAPRDKVSLILPNEEHTAFTGRLISLLKEGIPGPLATLSVDELYKQLRGRMKSQALPEPQRRSTGTAELLALGRNRAYWPSRRNEAEERAAREAEERAAREAEERAARQAEERAARQAEERAARQAEERAARQADGGAPIGVRAAGTSDFREDVKSLVRRDGAESSYACSVCAAVVKGRNLLSHLDNQHRGQVSGELPRLDIGAPPVVSPRTRSKPDSRQTMETLGSRLALDDEVDHENAPGVASYTPSRTVKVVTVGGRGSGKRTLATAMQSVALRRWPQQNAISIPLSDRRPYQGRFSTDRYSFLNVVAPDATSLAGGIFTKGASIVVVVYTVDSTAGPRPEDDVLLQRLQANGAQRLAVALTKSDLVSDEEVLELVELEMREVLCRNNFNGDDLPVIRTSATRVESPVKRGIFSRANTRRDERQVDGGVEGLIDSIHVLCLSG